MQIRVLTSADAVAAWSLRLEALETEPEAFAESANEHRAITLENYASRLTSSPENYVLGALDGEELVGMAGFYREQRVKRRHIGHIWGVYVRPSHRSGGLGRALLAHTLEEVRQRAPEVRQVHLAVTIGRRHARALYNSLGFQTYALEPAALRIEDRYVDQEHMIVELAAG